MGALGPVSGTLWKAWGQCSERECSRKASTDLWASSLRESSNLSLLGRPTQIWPRQVQMSSQLLYIAKRASFYLYYTKIPVMWPTAPYAFSFLLGDLIDMLTNALLCKKL